MVFIEVISKFYPGQTASNPTKRRRAAAAGTPLRGNFSSRLTAGNLLVTIALNDDDNSRNSE